MTLRVLITGASGQLGSALLQESSRRSGLETVSIPRELLDLDSPRSVGGVLAHQDFDVLVNCAAHTRVDDAEAEAAAAFRVNAHAVRELADACRRKGARLVTMSTDYVFAGLADRPYAEDAAPGPLNVYGASKLMGEALARSVWPEGTLIIRTASVFGLRASPARGRGNFLETVIAAALAGQALRVVDDIVMSPTWAGHLASAVLDLIEREAPSGIWHMAGAGAASWHQLAVAALEAVQADGTVVPIPSSEYPTPARRPRFSVLDCSRAAALGIRLPDWKAGVRAYMAEREHGSAGDGRAS